MKAYLLLLLLLPLCLEAAERYEIQCYGHDHLMVNNMLLDCSGKIPQACYTRDSGEKGCTPLKNCSRPGWTCCRTNSCNR